MEEKQVNEKQVVVAGENDVKVNPLIKGFGNIVETITKGVALAVGLIGGAEAYKKALEKKALINMVVSLVLILPLVLYTFYTVAEAVRLLFVWGPVYAYRQLAYSELISIASFWFVLTSLITCIKAFKLPIKNEEGLLLDNIRQIVVRLVEFIGCFGLVFYVGPLSEPWIALVLLLLYSKGKFILLTRLPELKAAVVEASTTVEASTIVEASPESEASPTTVSPESEASPDVRAN
jgi:hypothetical protein